MPETTPNNGSTADSDENVTRKILGHIDSQVHVIGQQLAEMYAVLEEYRPLLAMLRRPDGKPDLVGAATVKRRLRRG